MCAFNNNPIKIAAVTVNWNKPEVTCACIDLLLNQKNVHPHIILVDNGSTDNSIDYFRDKYSEGNVELLELPRNVGFAGGYNAGIRAALDTFAEYILIINNDVEPSPDLIQLLLQVMDDSVGVTSPAIYYYEKPTEIWSIGGDINQLLLAPLDAHNRKANIASHSIQRTFLSGCVMLFKREVFDRVGCFDEQFFMYYEDLDLCLRIKKAGIKMIVVPNAAAYHKVSVSSDGENTPFERYHSARSSGLYYRKHMVGLYPLWIVPCRLGSALLWSLRLLLQRKQQSLKAYWKGLVDGWLRRSK